MATNPNPPDLEVTPDAPAEVIAPPGPEIVYFGEGAEKVPFKVNPNARKYEVFASHGIVIEYLK